jgi:hypothetical protein
MSKRLSPCQRRPMQRPLLPLTALPSIDTVALLADHLWRIMIVDERCANRVQQEDSQAACQHRGRQRLVQVSAVLLTS